MGRGGYTVQKVKDNLSSNNDGSQFNASIIQDIVTNCSTTNATPLERCDLALWTQQPTYVFIDIGVNDVGFGPPWVFPNQTTWQNNYISILDTLHAQWPDALIYITIPWKFQTGGDNTVWDTMAGWVANVVAARSTFTFTGDDERGWFQLNPSYAVDTPPTMIHFNTAAGSVAAAAAKLAVLP